MSRVVIRIGNTIKDGMLTPAFAVDLEERKLAEAQKLGHSPSVAFGHYTDLSKLQLKARK